MQLPKESEDHVMEERKESKLLFSRKIVGELTVPERPDLTFIRVEPELELSKMSRHLRIDGKKYDFSISHNLNLLAIYDADESMEGKVVEFYEDED